MSYDTPQTADASYAELAFNALGETANRIFTHPLFLLAAALMGALTATALHPVTVVTYFVLLGFLAGEAAAERGLIETGPIRWLAKWLCRRARVNPERDVEWYPRDYAFLLALLVCAAAGTLLASPVVAPLVIAASLAAVAAYVGWISPRRPTVGGERL